MTKLLTPSAKQQFFNDAGDPASGYKLYTYAANSTTPQATYSNRAGTVENTNPIILDARGEATIYLTTGLVYDYVLKTADDVTVWTREDVEADPLATDLATPGPETGAALVSFIQSGAGAAARTIQAKLREIDLSIYDFGYVDGQDATLPIQRAINALPARGGTVRLPPGQLNISAQIMIGNGNGSGTISTKAGVRLIGAGAGFAQHELVPTVLNWIGAPQTAPAIAVNGRINGVELAGFWLACQNGCGGISMLASSGFKIRDVKIVNPRSGGNALSIIGGGAPTGNYNIFNRVENVHIALFQPNSNGLFMHGDFAVQNDTWISTFERVRIETVLGATNAVCAWFKFVDSCTFTRCHFDSTPEPTSIGVVFDALDNHTFPAGMAFYDCSIKNHAVYEDGSHTIRKNYFYGFGTYDLEVIPTHSMLVGITDDGQVFGDFLYNSPWTAYTPTVTLVGGAGNTVPQYNTNWGAYKKIGKTVHYTILLDGDGGAEGAGTGNIRIALPFPAASGNRYWESIGRVVNDVNSYIGIARIDAGSSTIRVRHFNTATTTGDVPGSGQGSTTRTIAFSGTYECA